MEIEGKIIVVAEPRSGISPRTGSAWKAQEFVIETHEQYPRKCCFDVFGEDRLSAFKIQLGEELRVSFDINAREYNGRWYNSLRAWKVERIDPAAAQAATYNAPQPAPGAFPPPPPAQSAPATPSQAGESVDDLPF